MNQMHAGKVDCGPHPKRPSIQTNAEQGGQPERRIGRVLKSTLLGRHLVTLVVERITNYPAWSVAEPRDSLLFVRLVSIAAWGIRFKLAYLLRE